MITKRVLFRITSWSLFCVAVAALSATVPAQTPPGAAPPTDMDLSSPRATFRSFLVAMNAVQAGETDRLQAAMSCVYVPEAEEPGGTRETEELVQQLFEVIDRFTLSLDEIPEPGRDRRDVTAPLEDGAGRAALALHRYEDNTWRFSSATLRETPALYAALVAGQTADEIPAGANPRLRSPRETMRTFIEGMNRYDDEGKADALSALDLSEINEATRDIEGLELAICLKGVLDRDKMVVYQEIPRKPEGDRYVHLVHPKGDIVIAPVDLEGGGREWRFTARTLESVQDLYDAYKKRPPVAAVGTPQRRSASVTIRDWIGDHVPFLLTRTFFLENWQWLGLLVVILVGAAVSRVIAFLLLTLLRRWSKRDKFAVGAKLEKDFIRPIHVALMAWVCLLGLGVLGLRGNALLVLRNAAKTISAVGCVWALYRLIDIIGLYLTERARRTDNRFDDILVPLITRSLKVFVVVFGVVFVAETLQLPYKSVFAGLGLGGLAFALAAKDTVSNIFGSVTILADKPFQIGDWVIIGDTEGSVESVGIRSTRIRTFYNSLITVPNSELINATIDNMGARRYRRIKMMIAVTYGTSPEKIEAFCEGIRHLIRIHPYTRKDYYHVWLNEFADSSLNILLYCFHETPDWATELRERHRLFLDIVRLAKRLGVEFAFPARTVYMRQEQPGTPEAAAPDSADKALVLGRKEAERIIAETLGKDAPIPPPVYLTAGVDKDAK